jgi:hypothetical protein
MNIATAPDGHAHLRCGTEDRLGDADRVDADEIAQAAREEHAGQRHDEGLQPEALDQHAHQRAEGGAHHQHARDDQPGIPLHALDAPRAQHRGQGDHRAHRQVDATGQDHEGHADRDDAEEGVVDQQVEHHLRGEEAVVGDAAVGRHRGEQAEGDAQRQPLAVQAPGGARGRRRLGRGKLEVGTHRATP